MVVIADSLFDEVTLHRLLAMDSAERDALPYGVIGLDREGLVEIYNQTEANLAGLEQETVIGTSFFDSVAQCMNNFMVAQRLEDETDLDETIPYVLTLRMRPTRVRLRMLSSSNAATRFILIER